MKKLQAILLVGILLATNFIFAQTNPSVWILTDFTGAIKYPDPVNGESKAVTDANSDADDQVAMAMYLMMANKFNTKKIVLGSTTKDTKLKTVDKFNETFGDAYKSDLVCLNAKIGGFPTSLANLNVIESSLTAGTNNFSFSNTPDEKYKPIGSLLSSVKLLVDELKKPDYTAQKPLYVLVWGPMTEIAMVTKHLILNKETEALKRLFVISHWTSSFTNQTGPPCTSSFLPEETQFNPANCNENCPACSYMHKEAKKTGALFKFVDLGSVGQSGVVDGSKPYFVNGINGDAYKSFKKSKLGDLFVKSKFVGGKPDGSDCATFLALLGTYGVKLTDYSSNGVLTEPQEVKAATNFKNTAQALMKELNDISNKVTSNCVTTTTPVTTVLKAYPNPTTGIITLPEVLANDKIKVINQSNGNTVLNKTITQSGSTELNITNQPSGNYNIQLERSGQLITRQIVKQ